MCPVHLYGSGPACHEAWLVLHSVVVFDVCQVEQLCGANAVDSECAGRGEAAAKHANMLQGAK